MIQLSDRVASSNQVPSLNSVEQNVTSSLTQPVGAVLSATPVTIKTIRDQLKVQVLDALLSGMRYPSGLLHQRLRGKQLVYVVHALPLKFQEQDFLFTYALTDSDNVQKVLNIKEQSMQELTHKITVQQFELAKSQVLFNMQNTLQNRHDKSKHIVSQLIKYGRMIDMVEFEKELNALTIDDIKKMATVIFNNQTQFVKYNNK